MKRSKILFLEKAAPWNRGSQIVTVLIPDSNGHKQKVGFIVFDIVGGKKTYGNFDLKGNPFPDGMHDKLFEAKKHFVSMESALIAALNKTEGKG